MANTLDFEIKPTDDYNRFNIHGYTRKIKLKEESRAKIASKVEIYKAKLEEAVNDLENVKSDLSDFESPQAIDDAVTKRAELIARIEAKISALSSEYQQIKSIKERAIKIKNVWYENCEENSRLLNENAIQPQVEEEIVPVVELPTETEVNEVPNEEVIAPIEEEPIEEDTIVENEEVVEDNISTEEIVDEISNAMDEVQIEENPIEEDDDIVSKNAERSINPNIDEEGLTRIPLHRDDIVLPTIPKISLPKIKKEIKIEDDDFVSSDYRLDQDIEEDISDRINNYDSEVEAQREMNKSDMNELTNIITNSTDIEEMKAAIESFKQRKLEQEQTNREKRAAEEARREEEARLEEVKRRNQEAVEKLRMQNEAIAEDIEYNLKISEEERQRTEELRKQRELQEELYGELENEILDNDNDYIKK